MDAALTDLTAGFAVRQLTGAQSGGAQSQGFDDGPSDDSEGVDAVAKGDSITLSDAAHSVLNGEGTAAQGEDPRQDHPAGTRDAADGDKPKDEESEEGSTDPSAPRGVDGKPLSDDEVQEVERLEERDQEVRTHEQAHQTVGGQHAGTPSYDYETGPDGKQYATSGEVPIDVGAVPNNPEATIAKMEQVKRAALAPAEPSAADKAIAAKADQAKLKAQRELAEQQAEGGVTGNAPGAPTTDRQQPTDPTATRGSLLSLSA